MSADRLVTISRNKELAADAARLEGLSSAMRELTIAKTNAVRANNKAQASKLTKKIKALEVKIKGQTSQLANNTPVSSSGGSGVKRKALIKNPFAIAIVLLLLATGSVRSAPGDTKVGNNQQVRENVEPKLKREAVVPSEAVYTTTEKPPKRVSGYTDTMISFNDGAQIDISKKNSDWSSVLVELSVEMNKNYDYVYDSDKMFVMKYTKDLMAITKKIHDINVCKGNVQALSDRLKKQGYDAKVDWNKLSYQACLAKLEEMKRVEEQNVVFGHGGVKQPGSVQHIDNCAGTDFASQWGYLTLNGKPCYDVDPSVWPSKCGERKTNCAPTTNGVRGHLRAGYKLHLNGTNWCSIHCLNVDEAFEVLTNQPLCLSCLEAFSGYFWDKTCFKDVHIIERLTIYADEMIVEHDGKEKSCVLSIKPSYCCGGRGASFKNNMHAIDKICACEAHSSPPHLFAIQVIHDVLFKHGERLILLGVALLFSRFFPMNGLSTLLWLLMTYMAFSDAACTSDMFLPSRNVIESKMSQGYFAAELDVIPEYCFNAGNSVYRIEKIRLVYEYKFVKIVPYYVKLACAETNWACASGAQKELDTWLSACGKSCVDGVFAEWEQTVTSFAGSGCAGFWLGVRTKHQFCISIGGHDSMMRMYEVVSVAPKLELDIEEIFAGNNGSRHLTISEEDEVDGTTFFSLEPKQWTRPTYLVQRGHADLCAYTSVPLGTICGSNSLTKPNEIDWHCFSPEVKYDQATWSFDLALKAKTGDQIYKQFFQKCLDGVTRFDGYTAKHGVEIKHAMIKIKSKTQIKSKDVVWCDADDVKYEISAGMDGFRSQTIVDLSVTVRSCHIGVKLGDCMGLQSAVQVVEIGSTLHTQWLCSTFSNNTELTLFTPLGYTNKKVDGVVKTWLPQNLIPKLYTAKMLTKANPNAIWNSIHSFFSGLRFSGLLNVLGNLREHIVRYAISLLLFWICWNNLQVGAVLSAAIFGLLAYLISFTTIIWALEVPVLDAHDLLEDLSLVVQYNLDWWCAWNFYNTTLVRHVTQGLFDVSLVSLLICFCGFVYGVGVFLLVKAVCAVSGVRGRRDLLRPIKHHIFYPGVIWLANKLGARPAYEDRYLLPNELELNMHDKRSRVAIISRQLICNQFSNLGIVDIIPCKECCGSTVCYTHVHGGWVTSTWIDGRLHMFGTSHVILSPITGAYTETNWALTDLRVAICEAQPQMYQFNLSGLSGVTLFTGASHFILSGRNTAEGWIGLTRPCHKISGQALTVSEYDKVFNCPLCKKEKGSEGGEIKIKLSKTKSAKIDFGALWTDNADVLSYLMGLITGSEEPEPKGVMCLMVNDGKVEKFSKPMWRITRSKNELTELVCADFDSKVSQVSMTNAKVPDSGDFVNDGLQQQAAQMLVNARKQAVETASKILSEAGTIISDTTTNDNPVLERKSEDICYADGKRHHLDMGLHSNSKQVDIVGSQLRMAATKRLRPVSRIEIMDGFGFRFSKVDLSNGSVAYIALDSPWLAAHVVENLEPFDNKKHVNFDTCANDLTCGLYSATNKAFCCYTSDETRHVNWHWISKHKSLFCRMNKFGEIEIAKCYTFYSKNKCISGSNIYMNTKCNIKNYRIDKAIAGVVTVSRARGKGYDHAIINNDTELVVLPTRSIVTMCKFSGRTLKIADNDFEVRYYDASQCNKDTFLIRFLNRAHEIIYSTTMHGNFYDPFTFEYNHTINNNAIRKKQQAARRRMKRIRQHLNKDALITYGVSMAADLKISTYRPIDAKDPEKITNINREVKVPKKKAKYASWLIYRQKLNMLRNRHINYRRALSAAERLKEREATALKRQKLEAHAAKRNLTVEQLIKRWQGQQAMRKIRKARAELKQMRSETTIDGWKTHVGRRLLSKNTINTWDNTKKRLSKVVDDARKPTVESSTDSEDSSCESSDKDDQYYEDLYNKLWSTNRGSKETTPTEDEVDVSILIEQVEKRAADDSSLRKTWDIDPIKFKRRQSAVTGPKGQTFTGRHDKSFDSTSTEIKGLLTKDSRGRNYMRAEGDQFLPMHVAGVQMKKWKYYHFDLFSDVKLYEVTKEVTVLGKKYTVSDEKLTSFLPVNGGLYYCESKYITSKNKWVSGTPVYNSMGKMCAVLTIRLGSDKWILAGNNEVKKTEGENVANQRDYLLKLMVGEHHGIEFTKPDGDAHEVSVPDYAEAEITGFCEAEISATSSAKGSDDEETTSSQEEIDAELVMMSAKAMLLTADSRDSEIGGPSYSGSLENQDIISMMHADAVRNNASLIEYINGLETPKFNSLTTDILVNRLKSVPQEMRNKIIEYNGYFNYNKFLLESALQSLTAGDGIPQISGNPAFFGIASHFCPYGFILEIGLTEKGYSISTVGGHWHRLMIPMGEELAAVRHVLSIIIAEGFPIIYVKNTPNVIAQVDMVKYLSFCEQEKPVLILFDNVWEASNQQLKLAYENYVFISLNQCAWSTQDELFNTTVPAQAVKYLDVWKNVAAMEPPASTYFMPKEETQRVNTLQQLLGAPKDALVVVQLESLTSVGCGFSDEHCFSSSYHVVKNGTVYGNHQGRVLRLTEPRKDKEGDVIHFGEIRPAYDVKKGEILAVINPAVNLFHLLICNETNVILNTRRTKFMELLPLVIMPDGMVKLNCWQGLPGASGSPIVNVKGDVIGVYGLGKYTTDAGGLSLEADDGNRLQTFVVDASLATDTRHYFSEAMKEVVNTDLPATAKYFLLECATGIGKTTIGTVELMNLMTSGQNVLLLQPGVLAVRNAFARIRQLLDVDGANRNKYCVRYEVGQRHSDSSQSVGFGDIKLDIMTYGKALVNAMAVKESYTYIILDEIHCDDDPTVLCGDIVFTSSQRAKVIHMSATPRKQVGAYKLRPISYDASETAHVIRNVDFRYNVSAVDSNYCVIPRDEFKGLVPEGSMNCGVPMKYLNTGIVLFFGASKKDCDDLSIYCENKYSKPGRNFVVVHSGVEFKPASLGNHAWVFCTDIVGKAVTIKGCVTVVDFGLEIKPKTIVHDYGNCLKYEHRLERRQIDYATAKQRKGRTGRTNDGFYISLGNVSRPSTHEIDNGVLAVTLLKLRSLNLWSKTTKMAHYDPDLVDKLSAFEWLLPENIANSVWVKEAYAKLDVDRKTNAVMNRDFGEKLKFCLGANGDAIWLYLTPVYSKEMVKRTLYDHDRCRTDSQSKEQAWFDAFKQFVWVVDKEKEAVKIRKDSGFDIFSVKEDDKIDDWIRKELFGQTLAVVDEEQFLRNSSSEEKHNTSAVVLTSCIGIGAVAMIVAGVIAYVESGSARHIVKATVMEKEHVANYGMFIARHAQQREQVKAIGVNFTDRLKVGMESASENVKAMFKKLMEKSGISRARKNDEVKNNYDKAAVAMDQAKNWIVVKWAELSAMTVATFEISALTALSSIVGAAVVATWHSELSYVLTPSLAAILLMALNGLAMYFVGAKFWFVLFGTQCISYLASCIISRRTKGLDFRGMSPGVVNYPWTFLFSALSGAGIGLAFLNASTGAATIAATTHGDRAMNAFFGTRSGAALGEMGQGVVMLKTMYFAIVKMLSVGATTEAIANVVTASLTFLSSSPVSGITVILGAVSLAAVRQGYYYLKKMDGAAARTSVNGRCPYVEDYYTDFDQMALRILSVGSVIANPYSIVSICLAWINSRLLGETKSFEEVATAYAGIPIAMALIGEANKWVGKLWNGEQMHSAASLSIISTLLVSLSSGSAMVYYFSDSRVCAWVKTVCNNIVVFFKNLWLKLKTWVGNVFANAGKQVGSGAVSGAVEVMREKNVIARTLLPSMTDDRKDVWETREWTVLDSMDAECLGEFALKNWEDKDGLSLPEAFHFSMPLATMTRGGLIPCTMLKNEFSLNLTKVSSVSYGETETPIEMFKLSTADILNLTQSFIYQDAEMHGSVMKWTRNKVDMTLESAYDQDRVMACFDMKVTTVRDYRIQFIAMLARSQTDKTKTRCWLVCLALPITKFIPVLKNVAPLHKLVEELLALKEVKLEDVKTTINRTFELERNGIFLSKRYAVTDFFVGTVVKSLSSMLTSMYNLDQVFSKHIVGKELFEVPQGVSASIWAQYAYVFYSRIEGRCPFIEVPCVADFKYHWPFGYMENMQCIWRKVKFNPIAKTACTGMIDLSKRETSQLTRAWRCDTEPDDWQVRKMYKCNISRVPELSRRFKLVKQFSHGMYHMMGLCYYYDGRDWRVNMANALCKCVFILHLVENQLYYCECDKHEGSVVLNEGEENVNLDAYFNTDAYKAPHGLAAYGEALELALQDKLRAGGHDIEYLKKSKSAKHKEILAKRDRTWGICMELLKESEVVEHSKDLWDRFLEGFIRMAKAESQPQTSLPSETFVDRLYQLKKAKERKVENIKEAEVLARLTAERGDALDEDDRKLVVLGEDNTFQPFDAPKWLSGADEPIIGQDKNWIYMRNDMESLMVKQTVEHSELLTVSRKNNRMAIKFSREDWEKRIRFAGRVVLPKRVNKDGLHTSRAFFKMQQLVEADPFFFENVTSLMDPTAGCGGFVQYLCQHYRTKKPKVMVASTLLQKGHRVFSADAFDPTSNMQVIIGTSFSDEDRGNVKDTRCISRLANLSNQIGGISMLIWDAGEFSETGTVNKAFWTQRDVQGVNLISAHKELERLVMLPGGKKLIKLNGVYPGSKTIIHELTCRYRKIKVHKVGTSSLGANEWYLFCDGYQSDYVASNQRAIYIDEKLKEALLENYLTFRHIMKVNGRGYKPIVRNDWKSVERGGTVVEVVPRVDKLPGSTVVDFKTTKLGKVHIEWNPHWEKRLEKFRQLAERRFGKGKYTDQIARPMAKVKGVGTILRKKKVKDKVKQTANGLISDFSSRVWGLGLTNSTFCQTQTTEKWKEASIKKRLDVEPGHVDPKQFTKYWEMGKALSTKYAESIKGKCRLLLEEDVLALINRQGSTGGLDEGRNLREFIEKHPDWYQMALRRIQDWGNGRPTDSHFTVRAKNEPKIKKCVVDGKLQFDPGTPIEEMEEHNEQGHRFIQFADALTRLAHYILLGDVIVRGGTTKLYKGTINGTPVMRQGNVLRSLWDLNEIPKDRVFMRGDREYDRDVGGVLFKPTKGDVLIESDNGIVVKLGSKDRRASAAVMDYSGWDGTVTIEERIEEAEWFASFYPPDLTTAIRNCLIEVGYAICVDDDGNVWVRMGQRGSGELFTSIGNTRCVAINTALAVCECLGWDIDQYAETVGELTYVVSRKNGTLKTKTIEITRVVQLSDGDDTNIISTEDVIRAVMEHIEEFLNLQSKVIRSGTKGGAELCKTFGDVSFCSHKYEPVLIGPKATSNTMPFRHVVQETRKSSPWRVEFLPTRPTADIMSKMRLTLKMNTTTWDPENTKAVEVTRSKILSYLLLYPHIRPVRHQCLTLLMVTDDGTLTSNDFTRRLDYDIHLVGMTGLGALKSLYGVESLDDIGFREYHTDISELKKLQYNVQLTGRTCRTKVSEYVMKMFDAAFKIGIKTVDVANWDTKFAKYLKVYSDQFLLEEKTDIGWQRILSQEPETGDLPFHKRAEQFRKLVDSLLK
uniref:Genome polyprotein n=1 Tax=Brachymeria lasus associated flavi-like virus TaxID=3142493 RepID=A0AAT9JH95_9FLAV